MTGLSVAADKIVTNCRMCRSRDLIETLDLGHSPPADAFLTAEGLQQPEIHYPLKLILCGNCGLSQLTYVVSPEVLFSDDYPYESWTSQYFRDHFADMASVISSRFHFGENDMAVDIGSNVGLLLNGFRSNGLRAVGVEPVPHLAAKASASGAETINSFWDTDAAEKLVSDHGHAAVVTATNVFAHVDDLDVFTDSLRIILREDGIVVIEAPYFVDLIDKLGYDTIYHEHLSYILMSPVAQFFSERGFEVFDVEQVPMHGLSLRIFVGLRGLHRVSGKIEELIRKENKQGVLTEKRLLRFSDQVIDHKNELVNYLHSLKTKGKRIAGIGAPAKGNTLLNYCNLTTDFIDYLSEKAETKIGLFSPGMHIPVVADDFLTEDVPDYGLLLAWNLRDEIIRNLRAFSENGGRFIIPMPALETV